MLLFTTLAHFAELDLSGRFTKLRSRLYILSNGSMVNDRISDLLCVHVYFVDISRPIKL